MNRPTFNAIFFDSIKSTFLICMYILVINTYFNMLVVMDRVYFENNLYVFFSIEGFGECLGFLSYSKKIIERTIFLIISIISFLYTEGDSYAMLITAIILTTAVVIFGAIFIRIFDDIYFHMLVKFLVAAESVKEQAPL